MIKNQDEGLDRGQYTQCDSAGAARVPCGCRLGCTIWGACWRHQANTIVLSVCCGDAALRQITLTTYYCKYYSDIATKKTPRLIVTFCIEVMSVTERYMYLEQKCLQVSSKRQV